MERNSIGNESGRSQARATTEELQPSVKHGGASVMVRAAFQPVVSHVFVKINGIMKKNA